KSFQGRGDRAGLADHTEVPPRARDVTRVQAQLADGASRLADGLLVTGVLCLRYRLRRRSRDRQHAHLVPPLQEQGVEQLVVVAFLAQARTKPVNGGRGALASEGMLQVVEEGGGHRWFSVTHFFSFPRSPWERTVPRRSGGASPLAPANVPPGVKAATPERR